MYFSVGIVYSSIDLLTLIADLGAVQKTFTEIFTKFKVASAESVINLSLETGWIRIDKEGRIRLSGLGRRVINAESVEGSLRVSLLDMIHASHPPWIGVLSHGRKEAEAFLPRDVLQCLREASLFGEATEAIVDWWDQASKLARGLSSSRRLKAGRAGELLTLDYERDRTNSEPTWQAFESDYAGYDVLSVVSRTDLRALRIEVKASTSGINSATFHLSRRQWNVAQTSDEYLFHLWILKPKPALHTVSVTDMANHVAKNRGRGSWEAVEIPFSAIIG